MILQNRFQDQVFFAVARIVIPGESQNTASIGTGFLVSIKKNDKESYIVLVSNKHVFSDTLRDVNLVLHEKNEDGTPKLTSHKAITFTNYSSLYFTPSDTDLDLAALNITPALLDGSVYYKQLEMEMFATFSETDLIPGGDVWFVGYPENRFDTLNNMPLMRRGYIASVPNLNFNGKSQFVIDAQVFPGSSGSPVFGTASGQFKFLGVVTQTMIRNNLLQIQQASISPTVQETLGLGIVIKSTDVKSFLEEIKIKLIGSN